MNSKTKRINETNEIYFAIMKFAEETGFCQSWWLNCRNFTLKSGLNTSQINQKCKLLIKEGFLEIDKSKTSTSTGTCYKLTNKLKKEIDIDFKAYAKEYDLKRFTIGWSDFAKSWAIFAAPEIDCLICIDSPFKVGEIQDNKVVTKVIIANNKWVIEYEDSNS